jgi:DNA replication protein DnaC
MRQLGRVDLPILDDWGPEPLLPEQQRDLPEIFEDRYNVGSLIITSQLPVDRWYELVGKADAILDRIVHNAYRVGRTRSRDRDSDALIRDRLLGAKPCAGV